MTRFDPKQQHGRSIRLKAYDYSQAGAYFVTMVAWQRECLFGEIVNGEMKLNRYGEIVNHAWFDLPHHYPYVDLGAFVTMPNHVHGIIILNGRGGSVSGDDTTPGSTTAGKIASPANPETRPYALLRRTQGIPVWQRNYYEHIIRNEREMDGVWRYIESNPRI